MQIFLSKLYTMKFISFFLLFISSLSFFISCAPEEEYCSNGVEVKTSSVFFKNGEEVILTAYGSVMINGKEVNSMVAYYIDGKEVAYSNDAANHYQVMYIPQILSKGNHELGAKMFYDKKGVYIELGSIAHSITVIE